VVGADELSGTFSALLDGATAKPLSAWALGNDGMEYKAPAGGDGVQLPDGTFVYSFNGGVPNYLKVAKGLKMKENRAAQQPSNSRRSPDDGIGYWGIMHLNSSGAPIASYHFGDTLWGHNCVVASIPSNNGRGGAPQGYILAGNIEQPDAQGAYATGILVFRVSADMSTVVWSQTLGNLPWYAAPSP
jgi:hypothetical protein